MIEFILLFFPTIISLEIIKNRTTKSNKELLMQYPVYNIIINFLTMIIVCIYKNDEIVKITEHFDVMKFSMKYLLLATIIAVIIPYIQEFITKNIRCTLEIRRTKNTNEKKN